MRNFLIGLLTRLLDRLKPIEESIYVSRPWLIDLNKIDLNKPEVRLPAPESLEKLKRKRG